MKIIRCLSILLLAAPVGAQQLGTITFPTSGNAAAQPHFITGVLYLHSFEYPSALKEFCEAERLDPGFAMAYWGEAMTYTHPVWNEQDAAAARAALAHATGAPTPREQGYLHAVQALYDTGTKPARDTAYAAAMQDLARRFPQDAEAQLFYALSLIGLSQGHREVPTYLRAGAIAETVFAHQPDHPGAAHYVIHAYDDPSHAAIALSAARAYSHIAPDAAHAQHMTSHIFLALGLWDDVVRANVTSLHVMRSADHAMRGACGHYAEWLAYGYLQQGRLRDAAGAVDACASTKGDVPSLATMRAAYIVGSRQWSSRFAVDEPASSAPGAILYLAFGTGYAAVMRGDRANAARSLAVIDSAIPRVEEAGSRTDGRILRLELDALLLASRGDSTRALSEARDAARVDDSLPFPFGPPVPVKPPHELTGEMLLASNRPAEARAEFQLALARAPRRPAALLGLAQADAASGRTAEAADTYKQLLQIWHAADADLAELAAVRAGAAAVP